MSDLVDLKLRRTELRDKIIPIKKAMDELTSSYDKLRAEYLEVDLEIAELTKVTICKPVLGPGAKPKTKVPKLTLSQVQQIANKLGIDMTHLHLGSVMDTFEYYGIEAARTRIIEQLINVMEGKNPNYHHLSIYGDVLTWSGQVRPIGSAGEMEKDNTFPLASAYSAGKNLMKTALIGATESTNTVATPVMLGNVPTLGTNYSTLLIDEGFVKSNTKSLTDTILDL